LTPGARCGISRRMNVTNSDTHNLIGDAPRAGRWEIALAGR
jgi:hypothetical protein